MVTVLDSTDLGPQKSTLKIMSPQISVSSWLW